MVKTATVVGAGSWGTALAKHLADQGIETRLWARRQAQADDINRAGENTAYLPGFPLPEDLTATHDLDAALAGSEFVICAVPSHGVRSLLESHSELLARSVPMLIAIKGIENETLLMMSELFEAYLPKARHGELTYLGGPSFAREVAAGIPTAVSIAGHDPEVTERVQAIMSTERFRAYSTDDVVGVELGGALKNVVAIAAGVCDGLGFGHNSRAALITRGLAEMSRLAQQRGAHPLTMAGLGGMGDLVLTCTGDLSRNRRVGLALGQGKKLPDILNEMRMVAEGVKTSKSAYDLARREGVDMPIVNEVHALLYEDKDPRVAVTDLMTRPPKAERD